MEPKEKTSLNEEQPQVTESGQQPQEEVKDNTQEQQAAEESQEQEEKAEENELQKVREEAKELKDKYLRLSAEFDNYRKRTMKEKAELILNGSEKSLSSVLPIVDDFERALKNMDTANDVNAVKEGVQLIYDKFIKFLDQNGVKEIPTENAVFDVDRHEAVTTFPAPSEDMKGKIMDCVTKGYTLNDKVIRYPKVVVCD